jgi:hypothetical protein
MKFAEKNIPFWMGIYLWEMGLCWGSLARSEIQVRPVVLKTRINSERDR